METDQLKLSNQVCFPIYSVSRLITKAYKPHLDELGITYPQYITLLVLWEEDNISINEISKKLILNTNTLSPLLKRLEKLELIQRVRSNEDERIVIIQLTEKGKNLKSKAELIPDKLIDDLITEEITVEDMMTLKSILCKWMPVLREKTESK